MTDTSTTGIAVLRVRQSDVKHVGPTEGRIREIATFLAPGEPNNLDDDLRNFLFKADLIETETVAERLAERLDSLLRQARTLLIDVCVHPRHTDPARVARTLVAALRASEASIEADHRIVIFTHLPQRPEDTIRDSVRRASWNHQLLFVSAMGSVVDDSERTWIPPEGLQQVVKTTFVDWQDEFSKKVIRRRGVFMDDGPRPAKTFSAFRYNAERANYELQQMLELYIDFHKIDAVVWGSAYPRWLTEVFRSATTLTKAAAVPVDTADPDLQAHAEVLKDKRVLVVAPMYRSGGTLDSLASRVSGSRSLRLLAVLAKQPKTVHPAHGVAQGTIRRNTQRSIDYFMAVEHASVDVAGWQMRAAERLSEIHDPHDDNPVGLVGLWSLFAKYGAGLEHPAPLHPPIAHFPKLGSLDDFDALWLAESLVAAAEKSTRRSRSDLLVVIPDEDDGPNGSEPIRDALARKLGVAVVPIARGNIGKVDAVPDHLEDLVRDYASENRIVLMDESVVNFTTFRALRKLLLEEFGAEDIKGFTVLDASSGGEATPDHQSFYSWTPRRFEKVAV